MIRKKVIITGTLISLAIAGFVLRFYRLAGFPPGLMQDEALAGYEAYSILLTGKDHHGVFLPLTFQAFNDWIAHSYVYILVPFIKIFGLSAISIRLLPVLLSIVTIILIFLLAKTLTGHKFFPLIPAALFTFSWFSITSSRWSIPPNTVPFYSTLSLLFFYNSLDSKKISVSILSAIVLAFSLYSYPSLEAMLLIWFPISIMLVLKSGARKKKCLRPFIIQGGILIALSSPLILEHIRNPQTITNRLTMISVQSLTQNPLMAYISNYLSYFLPSPLFLKGETNPIRTIPELGYENPVLSGFYYYGLFILFFLSHKLQSIFPALDMLKIKILRMFILLFPILPALTLPGGDFQRASHFLPVLILTGGIGFYYSFREAKKIIGNKFVYPIFGMVIAVYFGANFYFLSRYFSRKYQGVLEWYFQKGLDRVVEFTGKNEDKYRNIIIDSTINQPYIYVLFYKQTDPRGFKGSDYRNFSEVNSQSGWLEVKRFRNYSFKKITNEEIKDAVSIKKIYNSPYSNYGIYEKNNNLLVKFEPVSRN